MNLYVALLAAFAAFVVGRSFYQGVMEGSRQINRDLSRRPRSRIVDITEGPVRITGRARPIVKVLRAPVTDRPCVAFHLKIDLKKGKRWESLLDDRTVPTFAIRDETGEAIVDPGDSVALALALVPDAYGSEAAFDRRGKPDEMLVVRNLVRYTELGFFTALRFEEGIIEVGELISVGGLAIREPAPEGERPTPRAAPERLVLRGTATNLCRSAIGRRRRTYVRSRRRKTDVP